MLEIVDDCEDPSYLIKDYSVMDTSKKFLFPSILLKIMKRCYDAMRKKNMDKRLRQKAEAEKRRVKMKKLKQ